MHVIATCFKVANKHNVLYIVKELSTVILDEA